jgi:peptidoglycan/xylan/chitin deacetylase (PgdA/CDA1 family)
MYHDVLPDEAARVRTSQSPTRSEFATHLREIQRRYRLVSLRQAVSEIETGGELHRDSVAITFDDGYPSVYTIAYPLLRDHGAPASVFLLTGWINQEMVYWWQHVRGLVTRANPDRLDRQRLSECVGVELLSRRGGPQDSPDRRIHLADQIQQALMSITDDERVRILRRLETLLLPNERYSPAPPAALTWDQIRRMAENGIEFEAHTRTHVNLRYTNTVVAEKEILESKREIEERLQRPVTGFAYPYGKDVDAYRPVETILARLGFTYAVNAVPGSNSVRSNRYSLWRASLPHTRSRGLVGRELAVMIARG